ncbi:unnamed protein product [Rhizophagus irregularis]|nr:unnamed protein product [Rhizophagus irregularis]
MISKLILKCQIVNAKNYLLHVVKEKNRLTSTPIALSSDLPIAMRLPQETLCQIFSNLVEHPVHFTRVAQVCKSWKAAADTHLYWRHLTIKWIYLHQSPELGSIKLTNQSLKENGEIKIFVVYVLGNLMR